MKLRRKINRLNAEIEHAIGEAIPVLIAVALIILFFSIV